jgi:hypothetical protein
MRVVALLALLAIGSSVLLVIIRYAGRGVVAIADELQRRLDRVIAFVASAVSDPVAEKKASMARLLAAVAMGAGIWTAAKTVEFAIAVLASPKGETGTLGILAGLATTLFATVCVGLLKRTRADGTSEPDDDRAPAPAVVASSTQTIVQTQTGVPTP